MIAGVLVRECADRDVPAVVELWKALMDMHGELDPFFVRKDGAEEAFAKWIRDIISSEDGFVAVAEVGDEVVGYCLARISKCPPVLGIERYGELHDCFVRADMRSEGIGSGLVERICCWYRSKGISRMEVRHSTRNPRAGEFWVKMGFAPYVRTLYRAP
ncbi:MAG: GNAT family N-acetyltransferase [Phycisphaerales bacterium]|nr:MAG: GNAT family N-acetyltransferase [Phycisphaerales bacterium]